MSLSLLRSLPSELRALVLCRITPANRCFTTTRHFQEQSPRTKTGLIDVKDLLSKPTWSVSSLLPKPDDTSNRPEITSKQLHHLLRLSALPPPKDADEEQRMLATLSSQLHFVKEIQSVDTTGIEPLRSLRDESAIGEQEAELGLDALKAALDNEELRGKYHKRIRRRRMEATREAGDEDKWDVLGAARKKVGRFFVVEGGKEG